MKEDELNNLFNEALDNIRKDRKLAREFLNEIANEISNDSEQNKYLSPVAAKHIETLQRSNEQLVKLIGVEELSYTVYHPGSPLVVPAVLLTSVPLR